MGLVPFASAHRPNVPLPSSSSMSSPLSMGQMPSVYSSASTSWGSYNAFNPYNAYQPWLRATTPSSPWEEQQRRLQDFGGLGSMPSPGLGLGLQDKVKSEPGLGIDHAAALRALDPSHRPIDLSNGQQTHTRDLEKKNDGASGAVVPTSAG